MFVYSLDQSCLCVCMPINLRIDSMLPHKLDILAFQ